jgi:hypothetical protein
MSPDLERAAIVAFAVPIILLVWNVLRSPRSKQAAKEAARRRAKKPSLLRKTSHVLGYWLGSCARRWLQRG